MLSFDELERLWQTGARPPRGVGTVRLITLRVGGRQHELPLSAMLTVEGGVAGDKWGEEVSPDPDGQVTLMNARVAELIAGDRVPRPLPGDNFLVDLALDEEALPVGARVRLGQAVIQVTAKPHSGCKTFRERFGAEALRWVNVRANRPLRLRGVMCRVVVAGSVAVGDQAVVL